MLQMKQTASRSEICAVLIYTPKLNPLLLEKCSIHVNFSYYYLNQPCAEMISLLIDWVTEN